MSKTPTHDQLDVAILWLEGNEGEGDERSSCLAVADWLKRQQTEKLIRSEARKAGIPVKLVRDRMRQTKK